MLSLPPQFQRELENIARKPFSFLEIQSAGQSAEITSEADWGTATSESQVDYTPTPPDNPGDVVLAADTTTTDTPAIYGTTDESGSGQGYVGDSAGYLCVDDPVGSPDENTTYVYLLSTGNYYMAGGLLTDILAAVPENDEIVSVTVHSRMYLIGGSGGHYLRLGYNGSDYQSAYQGITNSYANYSNTWNNAPDGSGAWTRAKLQLIDGIGWASAANNNERSTLLYLVIQYKDFKTTGNITLPFDLGASANTDNDAIISIDDRVPIGAGIVYEAWGSSTGAFGGEEVYLGYVVDGSRVPGYRYYEAKITFSGDGTVTGVSKSIKIEIPDRLYRFNNRGDDIFNSLPLLKSAPTRTIKLNLNSFMTDGSQSSFTLTQTEEVDMMLQENDPFSGLAAELRVGFYTPDITINDLVTLYPGLTVDYSISGGIVTVKIKDPMYALDVKFPAGSAPAGKPTKSYDGTHLCDVILNMLIEIGTPSRWVSRGSLDYLKANVGDGTPAAANFVAKRIGTNAVTESRPAKDHIIEILHILGVFLIVDESGKMTFVEYDPTAAAVTTWTGDYPDNFKSTPTFTAGLTNVRDACRVWYDYDGSDYGSIHVELGVADPKKFKDIKSKWISGDSSDGYFGKEIAEHAAPREINRLASGMAPFPCQTSLDELEVQVGNMVDIKHQSIVSPDDYPGDTVKFLVVQKTPDISGGRINWDLVRAKVA